LVAHALLARSNVHGAKNSALKLMAASLLAVGETTIENVPDIADVHIMEELVNQTWLHLFLQS
jgi:UDP-N-acetylglucosamine 1-carboxyvinyltransferase